MRDEGGGDGWMEVGLTSENGKRSVVRFWYRHVLPSRNLRVLCCDVRLSNSGRDGDSIGRQRIVGARWMW